MVEHVKSKSTHSVPVSDHHLSDFSFKDFVQKPLEVEAPEVEAGADVFVDSMVWVLGGEEFDLSFEVPTLLGRGDPRVDDVFLLLLGLLEEFQDTGRFVESEASDRGDVLESTFVTPPSDR